MNLLGINTSFTSSTTGFGLDEKVDEEQARKKSSQCDSQVSTELNLKGDSVGGAGLNNGVDSEGRGSCEGRSGGRDSGLGD